MIMQNKATRVNLTNPTCTCMVRVDDLALAVLQSPWSISKANSPLKWDGVESPPNRNAEFYATANGDPHI